MDVTARGLVFKRDEGQRQVHVLQDHTISLAISYHHQPASSLQVTAPTLRPFLSRRMVDWLARLGLQCIETERVLTASAHVAGC